MLRVESGGPLPTTMMQRKILKSSESQGNLLVGESAYDGVLTPECTPWLSTISGGIDPWDEIHAVLIPNHVEPGQEFLVLFLKSYVLKLKCPAAGATAGQTLLFFPPNRRFPVTSHVQDMKQDNRRLQIKAHEDLKVRLPKSTVSKVIQARFYTSPTIQRIRNIPPRSVSLGTHPEEEPSVLSSSSTLQFVMTVPTRVPDDTILQVTVLGQALQIHCPPTKKPGEKIYLEIPNPWESSSFSSSCSLPLDSTACGDAETLVSSCTIMDDDTSTTRFDGKVASTICTEEETPTAEISVCDPSISDMDCTSHNFTQVQSISSAVDPDDAQTRDLSISDMDYTRHNFTQVQSISSSVDPDDAQTRDSSISDMDYTRHNFTQVQSISSTVNHNNVQARDSNSEPIVHSSDRGPLGTSSVSSSTHTDSDPESAHIFDVEIPQGVIPGGSFPFTVAENIRVFITCPLNAHPGERVRFNLPLSRLSGITDPSPINRLYHSSSIDEIKMVYKGRRWMRPLRLSDMKFIWIPVDHDDCVLESVDRFDIKRSAFVRKLEAPIDISSNNICKVLSFIPASEASMSSNIYIGEDEDIGRCQEIFSARDIAVATNFNFQDKVAWFRRACSILRVDFFRGHVKIQIRRRHLLQDSINAVMSLDHNDLRKVWRFSFIEEDAIDAGGVSREWFESVSKAMFDPSFGLWTSTMFHQNKMQINPSSGHCHENDLRLFRFLGRVMGKALFDHHLVSTHMIQSMYKNILGWPLTFSDLQSIDEEYCRHLKTLTSLNAEELSEMGLDFTIVDESLAVKTVMDLIPNGALQNVTSDNLPEYLEACWMHKMVGRYKNQLCAFLLGFYDIIPEPLVTVFDFQELELVMCGVPVIDICDWRYNTMYTGVCKDDGPDHVISAWFWQLVEEMDQEMRARLLQFVTGCSGVPIGGFSLLQGNDGNVRLFTIHGIDETSSFYPRSHTCFNRLDLPAYSSKSIMKDRLMTAVLFSKGFDME